MTGGVSIERFSVDGAAFATLTIDYSAKLNALSTPLMEAFIAAVQSLGNEDTLCGLIVTGAGRAFVGGANIDEMATLGPETARAFITNVHLCCAAVRDLPVPVIARINGYTLGAGLELAAACDMRAAADHAVLGMPEVRLGIPSVVEAALLPALVGWGRAREMLLTGATFGAEDALRWGLVEKVAPLEQLDAAIRPWLEALAACEPGAVRAQKALIRRWEQLPMAEAIAAGIDAFEASWRTPAPSAAMAAHLSARKARKP